MSEPQTFTGAEWHRKQAAACFNTTWNYLEKPDRTREENDTILHTAHASRYHWEQVGTAVNLARGEWQISRVYSVLKRAEPALYHATRCLEICQQHGIGDFDLAFAYEALARASAVAGQWEESRHYIEKAGRASENIAAAEDKGLLIHDLETIPSQDSD